MAAGVASLLAALLLAMPAGATAATPSVTETFAPTGLEQTFTVPAGVTSVHVQAIGAAGEAGMANNDPYESGAPGGVGADVAGELPVTPEETLYVEVAGDGLGGAGAPGPGGGEGGGASDVRTVSSTLPESLESRLLVAGGGGGGGGAWDLSSGGRGGNAGADGAAGEDGEFGEGGGAGGGGAGTLTGGGLGAALCEAPNSWSGTAGALGLGGAGGAGVELETGGGSGGGGYWGGGGGEGACYRNPFTAGGGGGGSNYAAEGVTSLTVGLAAASTEPSVTISYTTPAPAAPEVSTIAAPSVQPQQGPQGPAGPAGPQGERGPAGPAAVYECHPRQGHGRFARACFVRVMPGSPSVLKATLRRGGAVYATGPVKGTGKAHGKGLTLRATRAVPAGRYRLVLRSRDGRSTSRYLNVK